MTEENLTQNIENRFDEETIEDLLNVFFKATPLPIGFYGLKKTGKKSLISCIKNEEVKKEYISGESMLDGKMTKDEDIEMKFNQFNFKLICVYINPSNCKQEIDLEINPDDDSSIFDCSLFNCFVANAIDKSSCDFIQSLYHCPSYSNWLLSSDNARMLIVTHMDEKSDDKEDNIQKLTEFANENNIKILFCNCLEDGEKIRLFFFEQIKDFVIRTMTHAMFNYDE